MVHFIEKSIEIKEEDKDVLYFNSFFLLPRRLLELRKRGEEALAFYYLISPARMRGLVSSTAV